MLKSIVVRTTLTVAAGCAAVFTFTGCETAQHRADRLAAEKMQQVEAQQSAAGDLAQLDGIQSQYDQLASSSSTLSPRMRILVRGHQAQVRFERATLMLADLRAKELQITRTISDLEKMGTELTGTQASVAALQTYDPSSQIQAVRAKEEAIQGTGQSDSTSSTLTLAKLQTTIDTTTAAIAKNKQDATTLKQSRDDALAKAEALSRQAEGEEGDKQLQDTAQVSLLRRDAGIADAQLDTLASQMAQLQADLDAANTQQAALQNSVAALDLQIQAMQTGWTSIQQQIDAQRKLEQQLIGADASAGENNSITITQLAGQLGTQLSDADTMRTNLAQELDGAVEQYGQASSEAEGLRTTLMREVNGPGAGASGPILKETMETLHPLYYNQQMAAAMEARATVAASKTIINVMMGQMLDGYQIASTQPSDSSNQPIHIPGLLALLSRDKTGMDMPQAIAQLPKTDADSLKQAKDDVDSKFQETLAAYDKRYGADDAALALQHNNVSLMGRSLTNRQWANYASLVGDPAAAAQHENDADHDESQIPANMRGVNAPVLATPPAGAAQNPSSANNSNNNDSN